MRKKKKTEIKRKPLEYYLSLQYAITLTEDKTSGGFVGEIKDLPGCMTQGETAGETILNMEEARTLWMETAYEEGYIIPLPSKSPPREPLPKIGDQTEYSGKVLLRVPPTLHKELVESAKQEGTSLNQYLLYVLTQGTTTRSVKDVLRLILNILMEEKK